MELKIREVVVEDAPALAHVLITTHEHNYRGIVPPQCLEFTEEQSATNWKRTLAAGLSDGEFLYVVEAGPTVIGYACGAPYAGDAACGGELRQINLLPSHHSGRLKAYPTLPR